MRESHPLHLAFAASEPLDVYWMISNDLTAPLGFDGIMGPLVLDLASFDVVPLPNPTIPQGFSTQQIQVPSLPPGVSGIVAFAQPLFVDQSFTSFLIGGSSSLVLLSSAF